MIIKKTKQPFHTRLFIFMYSFTLFCTVSKKSDLQMVPVAILNCHNLLFTVIYWHFIVNQFTNIVFLKNTKMVIKISFNNNYWISSVALLFCFWLMVELKYVSNIMTCSHHDLLYSSWMIENKTTDIIHLQMMKITITRIISKFNLPSPYKLHGHYASCLADLILSKWNAWCLPPLAASINFCSVAVVETIKWA